MLEINNKKLQNALLIGENIAVEFKRCDKGIGTETYKSVCSFLNRFGGDIYLGIEDNGTVTNYLWNLQKSIYGTNFTWRVMQE